MYSACSGDDGRIDAVADHPHALRAEIDVGPFRAVLREHGDHVAAPDAGISERESDGAGTLEILAPRSPSTRCPFACGAARDGSPKPGRARGTTLPACRSQRRGYRSCRLRRHVRSSPRLPALPAARASRSGGRANSEIELLHVLLLRKLHASSSRDDAAQAP